MPAVSILLVAVLIRVLSGHAAAPPPRWAPGDPTENVTAMAAVIHNEIGDKGFMRLAGVLPPAEVAKVRAEVLLRAARFQAVCDGCSKANADDLHNTACQGCQRHRDTPHSAPKSFSRARNIHRTSPALQRLVRSPAIAGLAQAALGVESIRLYQTVAFLKHPGDVESSWHQDQAAAPFATVRFVTVWIALDDVTAEMAPLVFATASHRIDPAELSLRLVPLSDRVASMKHLSNGEVEQAYAVSMPGAMAAGDVSVHLGWTLHRASANRGDATRPGFAASFIAADTRFYPDVLHMGRAAGGRRGIELQTEDGSTILVQLLTDDVDTWMPWVLSAAMIPGSAVDDRNCPVVYSANTGATRQTKLKKKTKKTRKKKKKKKKKAMPEKEKGGEEKTPMNPTTRGMPRSRTDL